MNPNWAEQVTAIATAIGCIGLTSTLVLAVLAARQLREAQRGRHAQLAADFIRRWDEPALVEARRLVAEHADGGELAATFSTSVAENSMAAYVLMRELDFYEQLGALDHVGAFDFELIDAADRQQPRGEVGPVATDRGRDGRRRLPDVPGAGRQDAPPAGRSHVTAGVPASPRAGGHRPCPDAHATVHWTSSVGRVDRARRRSRGGMRWPLTAG